MATQYIMQRDTNGWRWQVRISFGLAVLACGAGVVLLPGQELDRAFLALGLLFSLFSCFALAKTQRDNRDGQVDTVVWVMTVWVAFGSAMALTGWGLWSMVIPNWQKNYMLISWLFLTSSTFTLAKTVRDAHEATLMENVGLQGTAPAAAPASAPAPASAFEPAAKQDAEYPRVASVAAVR
jgi:hypothetical protein